MDLVVKHIHAFVVTFEWYTIDKDTGNKKILSGTGSAYTYTESGSASNG